MREILVTVMVLVGLGLSACGSDSREERTTVVSPPPAQVQPGTTVVVPPGSTTKVCPPGYASC
jgi:uncharacterized lipoprotein